MNYEGEGLKLKKWLYGVAHPLGYFNTPHSDFFIGIKIRQNAAHWIFGWNVNGVQQLTLFF
jgi:hypothetical protein